MTPEPADPHTPPPPTSASEALDRATAAYQFGDIDLMIDLSRTVAEGALLGNEDQRAKALSLLGIGLYLAGRADGAERAFTELVRLRPRWSLDAKTTRPEVVAFFREVRRRTLPPRPIAYAFLPPFGQFQNETPKRGWVIGGVEAVTLASAITTRLMLSEWRGPTGLCRGGNDPGPCNNLRLANWISVGALATTWAIGVVDALANHPSSDDEIALAPRPPKVA
ncbi:MAG TPA: hypothetical protein VGG33_22320, partial [Polyangia bacterium]